MANKFLVSVADAILRDPNTGAGLAYGKANITSAFNMSMTATEVRGGKNNPLLYVYYHDKKLEIKIEQAIFDKSIVALNAGTSVVNGTVEVLQTDCIVLSSGSGTLSATPTGLVTVFLPDGTIQTLSSSGSISVSGGGSQRVDVVYPTNVTADQLTVETTTPPTIADVTLLADVRDNTGVIVERLQIRIPRYQVSGTYALSFAANGVSNNTLDGYALSVDSTDCTSGAYFAKLTWIPVSGTSVPVSAIAAIPGNLVFSAAATPQSKNITALGIRGGVYANANITTSASFVISGSQVGNFSVGLHTGILSSAATTTASAVCTVLVSYNDPTNGLLTDVVRVTATA